MVTFGHGQWHFYLRYIEDWDVSKITDMEGLFSFQDTCNPEIGKWDVSNVTNFVSQSIVHAVNFQERRKHAECNKFLPL